MNQSIINRLKSVIQFSLALTLSKLIIFLLNAYLATVLSATDFGYISLYQSYLLTAILVFGFSLHSVFIRYYFSVSFNLIINSVRPYFLFFFVFAVLCTLFLFFLDDMKYGFFLIPITGFLASVITCFQAVLRCESNSFFFFLVVILKPVFLVFSFFILVFFGIESVIAFSFSNFSAVFLVITLLFFIYKVEGGGHNNEERIGSVFSFVFPLVIVQFSSLFNNVFDRFALDFFMSKSDVGLYSKAYLFGTFIGMGFDVITLLWAPYVQKEKRFISTRIKVINRYATWFLVLTFILFFAALSYFDDSYYAIVIIITLSFISRVGYQIYIPILTAFDKTAIVAKITIFSALITIFLNLLLIPNYGVVGAAVTTFISFFFISLCTLVYTFKLGQEIQ